MIAERIGTYEEAVGRNYASLLVVLARGYDVENASLLYRMAMERDGGTVFCTGFSRVGRCVRLPLERVAVPVKLDTAHRTVFVEILDVATNVGCTMMRRHGELKNPYRDGEERVSIVEAPSPEAAGPEAGFLEDLLRLSRMAETEVRRAPEHPLLRAEAQYKRTQPVFVESAGGLVAGLYWCREDHWTTCNEQLTAAPLRDGLFPATAAVAMNHVLRELHLELTRAVLGTATFPAETPNFAERLPFPQLSAIVRVNASVYETVLEEFQQASTRACPTDWPPPEALPMDHEGNWVALHQRNVYAIPPAGNPLSPFHNDGVAERWRLGEYVALRAGLVGRRSRRAESEWTVARMKGGRFVGVSHATGWTYGETALDAAPLRNLRRERDVTEAGLVSAVGNRPQALCYFNVASGRIVITHPLFPAGRCIAMHVPAALARGEVELLTGEGRRAAESLGGYVGYADELLTSCSV